MNNGALHFQPMWLFSLNEEMRIVGYSEIVLVYVRKISDTFCWIKSFFLSKNPIKSKFDTENSSSLKLLIIMVKLFWMKALKNHRAALLHSSYIDMGKVRQWPKRNWNPSFWGKWRTFISTIMNIVNLKHLSRNINPTDIYLFKVNNTNTSAMCEVFSKLQFSRENN